VKQALILILLAGSVLAASAQGQGQADGTRDNKSPRQSIPFSGGGIRGAQTVVADGVLVTPSEAREFQGEGGYYEPMPLRARSIVPGIEILRPQPAPELKVRSPFVLAAQFKATGDAAIVPSTFKVLYGAQRVDITERITRFAQVTPEGFSLERAQLPPGKHKLLLQVQDARQRVAERELRLEVE
jgi:hypothetical protein